MWGTHTKDVFHLDRGDNPICSWDEVWRDVFQFCMRMKLASAVVV